MGRTAQDYGITDLSDETLNLLAGDQRRYGEKGRFAGQELASRRGLMGDANSYLAAIQKAAYGDAGAQYGAGLGDISNYLAKSGPLADSGASTALRYKLASKLYGDARGRIGTSYAEYLRQLFAQKRGFNYQQALLRQQELANKKNVGDYVLGGVGAVASAQPWRNNG